MVVNALKALTNKLASATIKADHDFKDVVEALKTADECRHVRHSIESRDGGQTHFLRVGLGGALLCVDIFTTEKYFAVRRGTVTRNGVACSFRWHHELDGFEYEGPAEEREILYQFLSEVLRGF